MEVVRVRVRMRVRVRVRVRVVRLVRLVRDRV